MQNMSTSASELLQFLQPDTREDLKLIALSHLLGLTDTCHDFFIEKPEFLEALLRLVDNEVVKIRSIVYDALINLSCNSNLTAQIVSSTTRSNVLRALFTHILENRNGLGDKTCMILANLTRTLQGATVVTDSLMTKEGGRSILSRMVDIFCRATSRMPDCNSDHMAYVLSNLCQVKIASDYLISDGYLKKLLPFLNYQGSNVRRHGIASLVRNCCFDTDCHTVLLSSDVDILPCLLLPLAGPEEFDDDDNDRLPVELQYLEPTKAREPDAEIRQLLVEALNQLCATKHGRTYLRRKNAYVILRELHNWEKNDDCRTAVLNVIDILIQDEPSEMYENLKEVEVPDELAQQFDQDSQTLIPNLDYSPL